MSHSRWVITLLWLSGSWRSFLYSSVYSCHLFLKSSASVRSISFLATVYRITKSWTLPKRHCTHRCKTLLPVAALPQWELSMKMAQLLGFQGPRGCQMSMDCFRCRSFGHIRVFFWPSCSWQSESHFGQSFSVAPPIQALRELPCLRSFSVARWVRHIEGPPRLGFYSVNQCIWHLKGHPGWCPTL